MNLRDPGAILLISCYELGHQPLAVASPVGFLRRAGFAPAVLDIAVDPFDPAKVKRARFVGVSVPMHTALRLGTRVAERVRDINPHAIICLYGLYAALNADYLLEHGVDYCIGGECETPLVALAEALDAQSSEPERQARGLLKPLGRSGSDDCTRRQRQAAECRRCRRHPARCRGAAQPATASLRIAGSRCVAEA